MRLTSCLRCRPGRARAVVFLLVVAGLLLMPWHFPPAAADELSMACAEAAQGSAFDLHQHATDHGKQTSAEMSGAPCDMADGHAQPCHNVTTQSPPFLSSASLPPMATPEALRSVEGLTIPAGRGPETQPKPPQIAL